jgi:hypothetical protein
MGNSEMNNPANEEKVKKYSIVEECTSPVYIPVIHGIEVWNTTLPNAYTKYMEEWKNEVVELTEYSKGGMVVPFEVRYDPNKGRALFTTVDIEKDTKVWTSTHSHNFDKEVDYLAFLKYLPHNLQCDIILWTYPIFDSTTTVALGLDEGNYMNDGGPGSKSNNLNTDSTALYHIKAGEELMLDYSEFIPFDHEVAWYDQLREKVFGKYNYTQQGSPPTLRAQNKNETVFVGDNSPFHDLKHDASPIVRHTMTSIYALLLVVVILKSTKGLSKLWSKKYHGH